MSNANESADLGVVISDTWSDEYCTWHVDFDSGAGTSEPWIVVLEWMSESGNPHHADWVTYCWQFYGETIDAALRDTVGWIEELAAWERCAACDGSGSWRADGAPCDECGGSGLAAVEAS